MVIKSGLRCVAMVLLLSPYRQRDRSHVCHLAMSPQFAGHIEAAYDREAEVEAPNKNGLLLRFEPGPQTIDIQTREDGVSIDQVVLSAEKYLTTRPGTAKNDRMILPATIPR